MIMKNLIVIDTNINIIKKIKFQIIDKIVNNIANDNHLIFTLLILEAYFCMQKFDLLFSILIQKVNVIKKIMKKIRIIKTKKQINNALNVRNKLITNYFYDLSLSLKILI